jgi:hypothetical protein
MIQNLEELKKMAGQARLRATLAQIEEIKAAAQATFNLSFEVEGKGKPSCIAEAIYRYYA